MRCRIACPPFILVVSLCILAGCSKQPAEAPVEPTNVKVTPAKGKEEPDEEKIIQNNIKTFNGYMANLKNKDPDKRSKAIPKFARDFEASDAIPKLLEALSDKGFTENSTLLGEPNSTREAAVLALLSFGPEGEKALQETGLKTLIKGTTDSNDDLREHSALAIGILGQKKKLPRDKAKPAIAALIKLCQDVDGKVREAAYEALFTFHDDVPKMQIVELMKSKDAGVARRASQALSKLMPLPKEVIPMMIDVLKTSTAAQSENAILTRNAAAEVLAGFASEADSAVPALVGVMKATTLEDVQKFFRPGARGHQHQSPLDDIETPAMLALRKIGKPAVGPVAEALNYDKWFVRIEAALVLDRIGPDAKEALPALEKAIAKEFERANMKGSDASSSVVEAIAIAVLHLGGDTKEALAKVAMLFKSNFAIDRARAARVAGQFGRRAKGSVDDLIALLGDADGDVRIQAIRALTAIGPSAKSAVPAIIKKVENEKADVQKEALAALKSIGPAASEAGPALAKLLASPDDGFRSDVIETIAAIGPGAKAAAPDLGKMLKRASDKERQKIIEALGAIGADAKSTAADVVPYLTDQNSDTRLAAIKTLGLLGSANNDVVNGLADRLKKEPMLHCLAVIQALARLGPGAKSAGDAVKAYGAKNKDPRVAAWCAAALYKMGVDSDANRVTVLTALKNKSTDERAMRGAAIEASDLFTGPIVKQTVVPELIDALGDDAKISKNDPTPVRQRAVVALGKFGALAKPAVPKLKELLDEYDETLKKAVLETLGQIGRDAEPAVGKLKEIVEMDPKFAAAAQKALDRIE